MSDPTPATPTKRTNQRFPRRLIVVLALLAAFVTFEVGVRLIQPDTLTYTVKTEVALGQDTYRYAHGTVTDPHAVAQWYTIVNATPLPFDQDNVFISSTFVHCNGMVYDNSYHFEFTWHGLPLESVVSTDDNNCGPSLWISRGGLMDPRAYALPYALQGATL